MRIIKKVISANQFIEAEQGTGTIVSAYRNLRKNMWSVSCPKSGLVLCHCTSIILLDAVFPVSETGRQRVLETRHKNVHAVIRGRVADSWMLNMFSGFMKRVREGRAFDGCIWNYHDVTYDPYKYESFVDRETEEPILAARVVRMFINDSLTSVEAFDKGA